MWEHRTPGKTLKKETKAMEHTGGDDGDKQTTAAMVCAPSEQTSTSEVWIGRELGCVKTNLIKNIVNEFSLLVNVAEDEAREGDGGGRGRVSPFLLVLVLAVHSRNLKKYY